MMKHIPGHGQRIRRTGAGAIALAVLVALLGMVAAPAVADDAMDAVQDATPSDENDPFPITVEVEPSLVFVTGTDPGTSGRHVSIHGRTLMMGPGSNRPVAIAIDSDDPPSHTELDAAVDKGGDYANRGFAPAAPGNYTITATAPDGRGSATATLTAVDAATLGEQADEAMAAAIAGVEASLDTVGRKLDEQADSPAKAETGQRIDELRRAHKAFRDTDPAAAIHGFLGAIQTRDDLLEKQLPGLREATATVEAMQARTRQLQRAQEELDGADIQCEAMAQLLEVVKLVGTVAGFEKKLADQFISMGKDVLADVASNAARGVAGASAGLDASLVVKNAKTLVKGEALVKDGKGFAGLAADLAAFATEQLFDAYCKRFIGPVDGTFTGKFYRMVHGKRTMWWKQDYKISGRILMRYPRDAKGDHVRMTGRIEGYAHSFESWDDGMVAFDEKGITKGAIIAEAYVKPYDLVAETGAKAISQGKGPLSAQVWGSIAGGFVPNSFAMHVRGQYDGDSISVSIGDRITDFTAATKAVNVVVSPLNTLGPTVVWYPLPYVDAHSVFAGAFDDQPARFDIATTGKVMTAAGEVDHVANTEHARGEYKLHFKLCNPGC